MSEGASQEPETIKNLRKRIAIAEQHGATYAAIGVSTLKSLIDQIENPKEVTVTLDAETIAKAAAKAVDLLGTRYERGNL